MSVRLKLDRCDVGLSLAQWRRLSLPTRRAVVDADCEDPVGARRLRRFIEASLGNLPSARQRSDYALPSGLDHVPRQVADTLQAQALPSIEPTAWSTLDDLQRFALCKLTAKGGSHNLRAALAEFGLPPARG